MAKENLNIIVYAAMAILLAMLALNALSISQISGQLSAKIDAAKQPLALPEIGLTVISASCAECSSASEIVAGLKALNVDIADETALLGSSAEARAIIGKYGIGRLPAVIVTGETAGISIQGFSQRGDALVFDSIQAPYEEALSGAVVGRVSAIILEDANCEICIDFGLSLNNLESNGVFIAEKKTLDYKGGEGQNIIAMNSIEKVPALLLSQDIEAYPEIMQSLRQIDPEPENGFYAVESPLPYIEVSSDELMGLINVTFLDDEQCADCYDVAIHRQILAQFGIAVGAEETVDAGSPEGKKLIQKYQIDKVPTIILQGDLALYEQFEQLWLQQLGTKEDDGGYVFRELAVLGDSIKFTKL